MKTPEDEAFEDIERRQGGGFPAKRAMAADKLHWSDCAVHNGPAYPAGECDCGVAQDPVAFLVEGLNEGEVIARFMHFELNEAKKTASVLSHHYPTVNTKPVYTIPPKREWVGLTENTVLNIMPNTIPTKYDGPLMEFAKAIEQALKDKNT